MFNKPTTMSVKEFLIRTLAVKMGVTEKHVEAVVNHQFYSINVALDTHRSVEISGFGKMLFSNKKALSKLNKLNEKMTMCVATRDNPNTSVNKKKKAEVVIEQTSALIATIKPLILHD